MRLAHEVQELIDWSKTLSEPYSVTVEYEYNATLQREEYLVFLHGGQPTAFSHVYLSNKYKDGDLFTEQMKKNFVTRHQRAINEAIDAGKRT